MLTDTQIRDEELFIYINDMLSSSYIPGLWPRDELDGHLNSLKNEAKAQGIPDQPELIYQYFIEKLKINLHYVISFSPVGENLRIKSRKYPSLINSTMIDWFHPWPYSALQDVALNFIKDIEFSDNKLHQ